MCVLVRAGSDSKAGATSASLNDNCRSFSLVTARVQGFYSISTRLCGLLVLFR